MGKTNKNNKDSKVEPEKYILSSMPLLYAILYGLYNFGIRRGVISWKFIITTIIVCIVLIVLVVLIDKYQKNKKLSTLIVVLILLFAIVLLPPIYLDIASDANVEYEPKDLVLYKNGNDKLKAIFTISTVKHEKEIYVKKDYINVYLNDISIGPNNISCCDNNAIVCGFGEINAGKYNLVISGKGENINIYDKREITIGERNTFERGYCPDWARISGKWWYSKTDTAFKGVSSYSMGGAFIGRSYIFEEQYVKCTFNCLIKPKRISFPTILINGEKIKKINFNQDGSIFKLQTYEKKGEIWVRDTTIDSNIQITDIQNKISFVVTLNMKKVANDINISILLNANGIVDNFELDKFNTTNNNAVNVCFGTESNINEINVRSIDWHN